MDSENLDRIVFQARDGAYGRIMRREQEEVYITVEEWNPSVLHLIKLQEEIESGKSNGNCIVEVQNWEDDGTVEDTRWFLGNVATEFPRDYHPEWGCPTKRCWIIYLEKMIVGKPEKFKEREIKLFRDIVQVVPPRIRKKSVKGNGILK